MLKDITIKNNYFEEIAHVCISTNDVDGLNILFNKFVSSPMAIWLDNQQNGITRILIEGNNYKGTRQDVYVPNEARFIAINPNGTNGFNTTNVKILNNIVLNANTNGIGLTANEVIIEGNHIEGSYRNGIYFYGGDTGVIANNVIRNNVIGAEAGRADLVIGNSGILSNLITVTGNNMISAIMGSNISSVFVQGNSIITITSGTAIVKNNMINGVFTV